jgi:hypothetical protein
LGVRRTVGVASAYVAITLVMTWPVALHPAKAIAGDLGDPLFNCWVLMWTAGQALRALGGDVGALGDYWNGNIFYPEPLTLAYSEHLTPQMLQMLPIYAAGGNVVLCYNLLFLSTFVVAGLGMYLLVRDLTGRPLAAFVAGLAFAFAPYRLGQFSHLQVLSTGWMPLALVGLRRYLATRRLPALAGGSAAIVVQGLSCGYYLLFFPPFAAAYALFEMTRRRLLLNGRVWMALVGAAAACALVVAPFVWPYLEVRERDGGLSVRSPQEVVMFSADTHAFATAPAATRLLNEVVPGFPGPEGEGFPGFTILGLAAIGTIAAGVRPLRRMRRPTTPGWTRWAFWAGALALGAYLGEALWILWHGSLTLHSGHTTTVIRNVEPLLWRSGLLAIGLAVLVRREGHAAPVDERGIGFFPWAALAAALLALGPELRAAGHFIGHGPYGWFFAHVPGFDGLRVPARFLALVTLFLAALAGCGAATLLRFFRPRLGSAVVAAAGVLILTESWFAPMATNVPVVPDTLAAPAPIAAGRYVSPLYGLVRDLPDPVVLVELPFGEEAYDIQASYYAGYHRRPILNGYSGHFPQSYLDRIPALSSAPDDPGAVLSVLADAGATHVLVHEAAFGGDRGRALTGWLMSVGAGVLGAEGSDRLLVLPPRATLQALVAGSRE